MAYSRHYSSSRPTKSRTAGASRISVTSLICADDPPRMQRSQALPSIQTLLSEASLVGAAKASIAPPRPHSPGIRKRGASSGKGKRLWTSEEDERLRQLAGCSPENWNVISVSLPGRTGKQCRERWLNHLRPDIRKGEWTAYEDRIILREQAARGNRWSDIARMLPGRSDNAVKNRYNATLKRQFAR